MKESCDRTLRGWCISCRVILQDCSCPGYESIKGISRIGNGMPWKKKREGGRSPRERPKGISEFVLLQNFQFILDKRPGMGGGRKIAGSLHFSSSFFKTLKLPCQQTIQGEHGRSAPESRSTMIYPGRSSPR